MNKDEMNEEELFCKLFPEYAVNGKPLSPYFDLFESGYEQAEKRIQVLGERCLQLQADKGRLTDKVKELEAENDDLCDSLETQDLKIAELEGQNEEMKCCANCRHSRTEYEHCKTDKHEKWEIKEND